MYASSRKLGFNSTVSVELLRTCERTKVIYVQYRLVYKAITAGRDGCNLLRSYALLDLLYNEGQTSHTDRRTTQQLADTTACAARVASC